MDCDDVFDRDVRSTSCDCVNVVFISETLIYDLSLKLWVLLLGRSIARFGGGVMTSITLTTCALEKVLFASAVVALDNRIAAYIVLRLLKLVRGQTSILKPCSGGGVVIILAVIY